MSVLLGLADRFEAEAAAVAKALALNPLSRNRYHFERGRYRTLILAADELRSLAAQEPSEASDVEESRTTTVGNVSKVPKRRRPGAWGGT